ncbi:hypothetical protein C8R48DRAFT_772465 [Suillus tomentosus]|nr:hypothetical protein C8R48DRAFT_772465 [Suillus tomentosus]
MTLWLECQEKMLWHNKFIHWRRFGSNSPIHSLPYFPAPSDLVYHRQHKIAKHPSARCMSFDTLANEYGAPYFQAALARFIAEVNQPVLTVRQLEDAACGMIIPFRAVAMFHKVRYNTVHDDSIPNTVMVDSIHVQPQRRDCHKCHVPARFDTVLVNMGHGGRLGVEGYRVAQVQVIFSLSVKAKQAVFRNAGLPDHFVYVEWFTPFSNTLEANHGMYKVSRAFRNGEKQASIIPVCNI